MRIPDIVSNYDSISTEKNRRGQDVILYTKTMEDDSTNKQCDHRRKLKVYLQIFLNFM